MNDWSNKSLHKNVRTSQRLSHLFAIIKPILQRLHNIL